MELIKELYFPTPIYYVDIENFEALNQSLISRIYSWRDEDQTGIVRSNMKKAGAWHSETSMLERPEFDSFVKTLNQHLMQISQDQQYDDRWQLVFSNMWVNINPQNGFNRSHTHPGALWSGVYYVQSPPDCGQVIFQDPRSQASVLVGVREPNKEVKPDLWSEVFHQARSGRLILFPSWLRHEVEPNLSTLGSPAGDRISISFNCVQVKRDA